MITIHFQQVWFEGNQYEIRFSNTSLNDPDEMPGMELLEVDGQDQYSTPSRIWEFCQSQMNPDESETAEEKYRW